MIDLVSLSNIRNGEQKVFSGGVSAIDLMWKVAEKVYENVDFKGSILIFSGSGNNGGDGYALACLLKQKNCNVKVIAVGDGISPSAEFYKNKAVDLQVEVIEYKDFNRSGHADIIVDCIFGNGLKRAVEGDFYDAISYINSTDAFVVSVDVNSGLNCDNGKVYNVAVKSNKTISIGGIKRGQFYADSFDYIGELINVDIGIETSNEHVFLLENDDVKSLFNPRKRNSHKGTYKRIGVMGGSVNFTGAVKLANMSLVSLLSGAGLSKVIVANDLKYAITPYLLDSTLSVIPSVDGLMVFDKQAIDDALLNVDVLALGSGWNITNDNYEILKYILESYRGILILDADALNLLSYDISLLKTAVAKRVILTPHIKEFSRLTKLEIEEIENNPFDVSKGFALNNNVILLLKGASSIITDGHTTYLNSTGCSGMAKGGSGDVLVGIIAGTVAMSDDCVSAVAKASFLAGKAGEKACDEFGEYSMLASDTVNAIKKVIKEYSD